MPRNTRPKSLKEIEEQYAAASTPVSPQILRRLQRDPRTGAQRLYRLLSKKARDLTQERRRLESMLHFERVLWKAGIAHIAGVDEVGIGPLAGPVVAAAVVFAPGTEIEGIDDSKALDPDVRDALDAEIRARATGIGLGVVEVDDVDRLNVYHAGLHAMKLAVEALPTPPQHVLVDSRTIPGLPQPQNSFDKGDGLNFSIAAASIVAKVHRDRLMTELDGVYPGYGFASHKGYSTPEHQASIRRLGPCPIHRRSFDYIRELCGEYAESFYALKGEAAAIQNRQALEAWEQRCREARPALSDMENKKLQLQSRRLWKKLAAV